MLAHKGQSLLRPLPWRVGNADTPIALRMPGRGGCTGGSLCPPRTPGAKLDDHDLAQTQPKGTGLPPPCLPQGVKLC